MFAYRLSSRRMNGVTELQGWYPSFAVCIPSFSQCLSCHMNGVVGVPSFIISPQAKWSPHNRGTLGYVVGLMQGLMQGHILGSTRKSNSLEGKAIYVRRSAPKVLHIR